MSIEIKTPGEVASEYLQALQALRPEINPDQSDSDWWIRSRVVGGVVSGVYSDLSAVTDDAFPQSARRAAVEQHLITYFGSGFREAQAAQGNARITGTNGTILPAGALLVHSVSGNQYTTQTDATIAAGIADVLIRSVATGQNQNLLSGTALSLPSPPSGIGGAAIVQSPGVVDGADIESTEAGAARVLSRIRSTARGGNASDYEVWALAASEQVQGVRVQRHFYGLGTVLLTIVSGTTDIDSAIDNDEVIVRIPSAPLMETVRAYVDARNPVTDAVYVGPPTELAIAVNASIKFATGDKDTIVPGTAITQGHLVEREILRALYKCPIGGRQIDSVGYMLAAEVEEMIDLNLSASPYTIGAKYQIVVDRQVSFTAGATRQTLATAEAAAPGAITITNL
jgi:uncharacterized phage protein gp47/JayE